MSKYLGNINLIVNTTFHKTDDDHRIFIVGNGNYFIEVIRKPDGTIIINGLDDYRKFIRVIKEDEIETWCMFGPRMFNNN